MFDTEFDIEFGTQILAHKVRHTELGKSGTHSSATSAKAEAQVALTALLQPT